MLKRVLGVAIPAVIVLVGALLLVLVPRGSSAAGDRLAWFEAPDDGDQVTTGQVTVLAAATDPMGIALLEFSVDGEFIEGRLYEGAPERVTAEFAWLATIEGDFRLTVRARGTDGVWGAAETIVLTASHHHRSEEALSPQTTTTATTSTTTTTAAPPPRPNPTTTTSAAPPQTQPPAPPATTTTTGPPVVEASCEQVPPTLLRPRNDATIDGPPVLRWEYRAQDPCRPDQQTLRLTGPTDQGGGELWVDLPRWATNWRPPQLEDCTAYTWKVFATYGGTELKSAIWNFTTDFQGNC